jgi:hypothetical protein
MSEKIELTVEAARDILEGYVEGDEYKTVLEKITGTRRWSTDYDLVIQRLSDGKLFMGWFSRGSTECQDERPWEYNKPEFIEVVAVERTVVDYVEAG